MENELINIEETLPSLIKNTHFSFDLQGWPAAITVASVCASCVAICALKVTHTNPNNIVDEDCAA